MTIKKIAILALSLSFIGCASTNEDVSDLAVSSVTTEIENTNGNSFFMEGSGLTDAELGIILDKHSVLAQIYTDLGLDFPLNTQAEVFNHLHMAFIEEKVDSLMSGRNGDYDAILDYILFSYASDILIIREERDSIDYHIESFLDFISRKYPDLYVEKDELQDIALIDLSIRKYSDGLYEVSYDEDDLLIQKIIVYEYSYLYSDYPVEVILPQ